MISLLRRASSYFFGSSTSFLYQKSTTLRDARHDHYSSLLKEQHSEKAVCLIWRRSGACRVYIELLMDSTRGVWRDQVEVSSMIREALMKCAKSVHVGYLQIPQFRQPHVRTNVTYLYPTPRYATIAMFAPNHSMVFLHAFAANASIPLVSTTPLVSS